MKGLLSGISPYLVLWVGLIATTLGSVSLFWDISQQDRSRFDNLQKYVETSIEDRLRVYQNALLQVRAFYDASEDVSKEEFHTFISGMEMVENFPGLRGIGFTERIRPNDLLSHTTSAQKTIQPEYKIWPQYVREDYFSILYLEPFHEKNSVAIGYDMATEGVRAEAMRRARDTALPALSGRVNLDEESPSTDASGFLLFVPLYQKASSLDTVEQRREALRGFIFCQVHSAEIFTSLFGSDQSRLPVDLKVYDRGLADPANQLYHRDSQVETPASTTSQFNRFSTLEFAGRTWGIGLRSLKTFDLHYMRYAPFFLFILGFLLSFLLFKVLWVNRKRREAERALLLRERYARKQAEESARRSGLLADASEVINTLDHNSGVFDKIAKLLSSLAGGSCAIHLISAEKVLELSGVFSAEKEEPFVSAFISWLAKNGHGPERVMLEGRSHLQTSANHSRVKSFICSPIVSSGKSLGTITLLSFENAFDVDDLLTVEEVGRRLALELEQVLSRTQIETLLNWMPTAIVLLEPKTGKLHLANRTAHRLVGGQFPTKLSDWHLLPPIGTAFTTELSPTLKAVKGETLEAIECRWDHPLTGISIPLLLYSDVFPAIFSQEEKVVVALQDISTIKEAEEKLQLALKTRDDFLSVASHELKTPLTSLKFYLQMIRRKPSLNALEAYDTDVKDKLDIADRQIKRLTSLIDHLLDVSRIKTNQMQFEFEHTDLGKLVEETALRFSDEAKAAGSAVEIEVKGCSVGNVDRLRIEQVLSNLISNAIKYGRNRPITVSCVEMEGVARLSVRDSGIGISEIDQERIFARFERAVSSRNFSGLGLGLYIVREIVESHGGQVNVESKLGEGSNFYVDIPLNRSDARVGSA